MVCGWLVRRLFPDDREGDETEDSAKALPKVRAMEILVSTTGDIDLILDWLFYGSVVQEQSASKPLQYLLLIVCVLGTICWLLLTSDGRLASFMMKHLRVTKFSTGALMAFGIMVEDLPQIILTFVIEDGQDFSAIAILNLLTAIYDVLIKLAEAYDQREDTHVTGGEELLRKDRLGYLGDALLKGKGSITFELSKNHLTKAERRRQDVYSADDFSNVELLCACEMSETTFIAGSNEGKIHMWKVSKTKPFRTFGRHDARVQSLCKMSDATFLSASVDQTVKMWNLDRTSPLWTIDVGYHDFRRRLEMERNPYDTGPDERIVLKRNTRISVYRISDSTFLVATTFWTRKHCISLFDSNDKPPDWKWNEYTKTSWNVKKRFPVGGLAVDALVCRVSDSRFLIWPNMWSVDDDSKPLFSLKQGASCLCNLSDSSFLSAADGKIYLWHVNGETCSLSRTFENTTSTLCKLSEETFLSYSDGFVYKWSIKKTSYLRKRVCDVPHGLKATLKLTNSSREKEREMFLFIDGGYIPCIKMCNVTSDDSGQSDELWEYMDEGDANLYATFLSAPDRCTLDQCIETCGQIDEQVVKRVIGLC